MERFLVTSIRLLCFMVLLTPLIVMTDPLPATFFPFIVGKSLYARTLIEILVGLSIVLILRYPAYRPKWSWLLTIMIMYVAIVLLASSMGVSPQRSIWSTYERMSGWIDITHWYLYAAVLICCQRTLADWRRLFNFNLSISLIMGILGLTQYYGLGFLPYLQEGGRIEITLGNPTYVGAYMMVNILIGIGLLIQSYYPEEHLESGHNNTRSARRRNRLGKTDRSAPVVDLLYVRGFWLLSIFVGLVTLFLSGTRGAFLGLLTGLIVFSLGYIKWGNKDIVLKLVRVSVACIVILGLVALIINRNGLVGGVRGGDNVVSRVVSTGINDASFQGRISSLTLGLKGFSKKPLMGWGPENFTIAYDRYLTPEIAAQSTSSFDQAHNKIVEELTTKGIVGLFFYLSIWSAALYILFKNLKNQNNGYRVFTLLVGSALVGYFVQNLFLFDTPGTIGQFIILMAFVIWIEIGKGNDVEFVTGLDIKRDNRAKLSEYHEFITASCLMTVLIVVGVIAYQLNYRTYQASNTLLGTLIGKKEWNVKQVIFKDSIEQFGPLANYPRIIAYNQIIQDWPNLDNEERVKALEFVNNQGVYGTNSEPEDWRMYVPVSTIFHLGVTVDPTYNSRGNNLALIAVGLAPNRVEVVRHLARSYLYMGEFDKARETMDKYLETNPSAELQFKSISDALDTLSSE